MQCYFLLPAALRDVRRLGFTEPVTFDFGWREDFYRPCSIPESNVKAWAEALPGSITPGRVVDLGGRAIILPFLVESVIPWSDAIGAPHQDSFDLQKEQSRMLGQIHSCRFRKNQGALPLAIEAIESPIASKSAFDPRKPQFEPR